MPGADSTVDLRTDELEWLAAWRQGRSDDDLLRALRHAPQGADRGPPMRAPAYLRESERSTRLLADLREGLAELRHRSAILREARWEIGKHTAWIATRLGMSTEPLPERRRTSRD